MAIERGVLEVNSEAFDFLCLACKEPQSDVGKDEVLFDQEYKFLNGYRMAIQCIASGNAEEPGWTQGVLFDSAGNELGTTDVGESFGGEYCVSHDGMDYIVEVIQKSGGNGGMAALLMGGVKEEEEEPRKYAQIAWTAEDVLTLRPDWTTEQAEDFLCDNESRIQDRTIEIGWEVLEDLL